jgi:hypothetical protein
MAMIMLRKTKNYFWGIVTSLTHFESLIGEKKESATKRIVNVLNIKYLGEQIRRNCTLPFCSIFIES